jgi:hypothetical protein
MNFWHRLYGVSKPEALLVANPLPVSGDKASHQRRHTPSKIQSAQPVGDVPVSDEQFVRRQLRPAATQALEGLTDQCRMLLRIRTVFRKMCRDLFPFINAIKLLRQRLRRLIPVRRWGGRYQNRHHGQYRVDITSRGFRRLPLVCRERRHRAALDFSRPGKPTDNAFIESFSGKFRAECLNAHSGRPNWVGYILNATCLA